jgi:hypothetical protein
MSITSTSYSVYDANRIGDNERQPSLFSQSYLSSTYDSDYIQEEYLRNIILNESEKLYNQKIEELGNQTICEAAVYGDNKSINEKQSIKALPLLGFAES